mgnify:FL=1
MQKKTEKQKIDAAIELGYWSDSDSRSLGSITDKEHNTEYPEFYLQEIWCFTEEFKPQGAKVFRMQSIPVRNGMENLRMPIVNWPRFWTVSELFRMI